MDESLLQLAEVVFADVVRDRRWLHQHPELSFQEKETARYIATQLRELGLAPETGIGGNGVKVVLAGNRPGPTIGLRADMDALPVTEETGLPFASVNPGVMHACGHENHVAMLLGVARALVRLQGDFAGRVVLVFQPGEEVNPGGASLMIRDGVLENPHIDAMCALHVNPLAPAGHMYFAAGPVMAAPDELTIVVRGKGGHGAYPHLTTDPVPAAAEIVTALQHVVSRNVPPREPAVVTIATIHGGKASNVIADEVKLTGTIRTMSPALRDQIPGWIRRVVDGVAAAHGCQAEVRIERGYPPVVNDVAMTNLARRAAGRVLPPESIGELEPSMGGEDFAYYLEHVPGCFARLGVAPASGELYPLHSAKLRVAEEAYVTGVAYWLALVREFAGE